MRYVVDLNDERRLVSLDVDGVRFAAAGYADAEPPVPDPGHAHPVADAAEHELQRAARVVLGTAPGAFEVGQVHRAEPTARRARAGPAARAKRARSKAAVPGTGHRAAASDASRTVNGRAWMEHPATIAFAR